VPPPRGNPGPLTSREHEMARIAWTYFENNFQPETCLVNAVDGYPSTTMWDTASYIAALVAARELALITTDRFDARVTCLLATLNRLSFFHDELPNKVYHAQTMEKVDYGNQPGEIGFSAIDLGRLLIWLKILKARASAHADAVDRFVLRWKFCPVLDGCGTMYGAAVTPTGTVSYLQEGRLGYEEYAAKGFQLWGFSTTRASKPEPYDFVPIYGVLVPYDTRDPRELGAHNYVVTESYVLDALELNWDRADDRVSDDATHTDRVTADFAQRIYRAQEERWRRTGILTARTEHQLDDAPYFVYDTIYSDGYPWNTISEDGRYVPQFAALALKAAVGLWAVWRTEYTERLFDAVAGLHDPAKGHYEGLYENGRGVIKTFTANNNGIILEALLYKAQGKLLRPTASQGLWERTLGDQTAAPGRCPPSDRRTCEPSRWP
jgi:uncharacterized protein DUF3131